jgi:ATP-dependent Lon protease
MNTALFTTKNGFIVDYLAEALRELRRHNYTEVMDKHFGLGSQLKSRDVKAVRKTVAGLAKLIHPGREMSREDLRELLELALEGRRRVKEQLKKMGSFEFFQTSFSYIDKDTGEEHYVGIPEEGGRNMISSDPLEPGSVYAAGIDTDGRVALCRIEIGCASGTGKLKIAGGIEGTTRDSIQRAFGYLQSSKVRLGVAQDFDTTDFHVESIDLLQNRVACDCGVAFIVAILSALRKAPVQPALVIFGDVSIQGNIKGMRTLVEPCQLAMENGAKRALIPIDSRRQFLEVSGEVAERIDPIFYSDPPTAANKALST